MTPLLSLRDLRVTLDGKTILDGLSADVAKGQITALIGLNGSGKTTLLRALLKEVPCTGEVRYTCGHDHSRPAPEHVGYVPQKLRIDTTLPLTVRDLFGLTLQRRPIFLGIRTGLEARMRALLARVGARPDLLDAPMERISGGEQQRVLLALALDPDPELLLLDEPAAGIDFQDQQKFYDLIADVNARSGVTVLLVSHDVSVVSKHAHHVLCLKDGRIQCEGAPATLINDETLAQIFGADKRVYVHRH